MTLSEKPKTPDSRIDPAAFFKKLGLTLADERPIMNPWREANAAWRRQHAAQAAAHEARIADHLRRFRRRYPANQPQAVKGRPKAVWCVELQRQFHTLSDAARFVGRKASNINQSIKRGVRCGPYHWEEYDAKQHFSTIDE